MTDIEKKLSNLSQIMLKSVEMKAEFPKGSHHSVEIQSFRKAFMEEQQKVGESIKKRKKKFYNSKGSSITSLVNLVMLDSENPNKWTSVYNVQTGKKIDQYGLEENNPLLENSQELLSYIQDMKNEGDVEVPRFLPEEPQFPNKPQVIFKPPRGNTKSFEIEKPANDQQPELYNLNTENPLLDEYT